ncbi:MAG: hypothetical protein KDB27_12940 [Planctomycetales bacterium]|nr:hypothetical protein [Planctomycetales bacterium]
MWCPQCAKDVVSVRGTSEPGRYDCIECNSTLRIDAPHSSRLLHDIDYWAPPVESRGLLAGAKIVLPKRQQIRIDQAEPVGDAQKAIGGAAEKSHEAPLRFSLLLWCGILIGIAAFTCGGILTCWGLLQARPLYWQYGVATTFMGCVLTLGGIVLQLDLIAFSLRQLMYGRKAAQRNPPRTRIETSGPELQMKTLKSKLESFGSQIPFDV